jgi:prevent-host-death family protein
MKTILISDFKAHCIAELNEAQKTGETFTVTRRGKPIARILPICDKRDHRTLGGLGLMKINEEIIHADFDTEWECNE